MKINWQVKDLEQTVNDCCDILKIRQEAISTLNKLHRLITEVSSTTSNNSTLLSHPTIEPNTDDAIVGKGLTISWDDDLRTSINTSQSNLRHISIAMGADDVTTLYWAISYCGNESKGFSEAELLNKIRWMFDIEELDD